MSRRPLPYVAGVIIVLAALFVLFVPEWVRPPILSKDYGPSALEMVTFTDPRRVWPYSDVPEPLPPAEAGGPKATEVYKNVKVLTNLSQHEFDRLMVAMTQWVAPKQGCAYCHDLKQGYAYDGLWTDKVTRQQISMTIDMNTKWGNHLAPSGVTCYTCHRGENVPPRVWYEQPEPHHAGLLGTPRAWQTDAPTIRQFFPTESFEDWYLNAEDGRIQSRAALPHQEGSGVAPEQKAENLYILMMQMSDALGVNCNYCHNSRALSDWSESTPNRVAGWWAMDQTLHANRDYITPLQALLPRDHLGQLGDVGKVECGTCHIGHERPLGGYPLLAHYPELGPAGGLTLAGEDKYIRDIAKPIEVQGPDEPAPKVVEVSVPAYPPPDQPGAASPGPAAPSP